MCPSSHFEISSKKPRSSRGEYPQVGLEYSRKYHAANRETAAIKRKQYYDANKDASSEYSRLYLQRNRVEQLERMRLYRQANPHMKVAHQAKRRAKKMQAMPAWFGEFDAFVWIEAAALARLRLIATGIRWHADHMIPLQAKNVSGLHVGENCQVIPAFMNNRKHIIWSSPTDLSGFRTCKINRHTPIILMYSCVIPTNLG